VPVACDGATGPSARGTAVSSAGSRPVSWTAARRSRPPAPSRHAGWDVGGAREVLSPPRASGARLGGDPTHPERGADAIDMADADVEAEAVAQCRLRHGARRGRGAATIGFYPAPHRFPELGRMAMSPLVERRVPAEARVPAQPIRRRPAGGQARRLGGLPPREAAHHPGHQPRLSGPASPRRGYLLVHTSSPPSRCRADASRAAGNR